MVSSSTKLHKFAVIVVAGDVDPGRPQRGQLQHGLLQLSTSWLPQLIRRAWRSPSDLPKSSDSLPQFHKDLSLRPTGELSRRRRAMV
jgi:hypothetical protein